MNVAITNFLKEKSVNTYLIHIACAFVFFINISEKISTLLLILFFATSILNIKNFSRAQFKKVSIIFLLFIVYVGINLIVEENFLFKTVEKKLSLFILPIAFSIMYVDKKAIYQVCLFFVYGVAFGCLLNLIEPFINDFDWATMQFVEVKQKVVFKNHNWLNHFYSLHFPNFLDRSYYSIYLNFAIAVVWYLLNWKMRHKIAIILFFLLHIFLSNSLIGLLGLGVLFVVFTFSIRKPYLILLIPVLVTIVVLLSPRLLKYSSEFWLYLTEPDKIPKDFLGNRWRMWTCSIDLIQEAPWFGYGKEGFDMAFNDILHEKVGWSRYLLSQVGFNSHNQYMQIWGEIGIFGVLIYIAAFISFIIQAVKKNTNAKFLKLTFILLIVLFSFSETVINRYIGISFFIFFYCFLQVNSSLDRENC
ncbi:O-antigen ligase [Kordia sp. SMS9]|uniref:O-antigen ligase family protein n=1 Tax=Kordia sp. SMS9 TaxID=2282170 RepID=UPI000E0D58AD|nr:O-antigen ligase family protein [Kordia sp. SMS9]AXG68969.1 O-antigen ligase [Kordia sp. SMS9]